MATAKSNQRHVPDYQHWSLFAAWTFEQACALSLGIDPDTMASPDFPETLRTQYKRRLAIVDSHRFLKGWFPKSGAVEPPLFIAWAKEFELSVPNALVDAVAKRHGKGDNWNLTQKYASEVLALKEDIYSLNAKCKHLESQLEGIRSGTPRCETFRALVPKEEQSLLKLVLGMAIEQYGYRPDAGNSKSPSQITSDLENCGISIDAQTVLHWLRIAAEQVDYTIQ